MAFQDLDTSASQIVDTTAEELLFVRDRSSPVKVAVTATFMEGGTRVTKTVPLAAIQTLLTSAAKAKLLAFFSAAE